MDAFRTFLAGSNSCWSHLSFKHKELAVGLRTGGRAFPAQPETQSRPRLAPAESPGCSVLAAALSLDRNVTLGLIVHGVLEFWRRDIRDLSSDNEPRNPGRECRPGRPRFVVAGPDAGEFPMKRMAGQLLMSVVVLSVTMMFGQGQTVTPAAKTPSSADAAAAELKQIENNWVEAVKTKNADRLGDILANDWVEMRWYGVAVRKMQDQAGLKAPGNSLDSFEMGPVNVRVFGNTAIVTGSDTEKSADNGKDTSGKYVWTDIFLKQSGKWKQWRRNPVRYPNSSTVPHLGRGRLVC